MRKRIVWAVVFLMFTFGLFACASNNNESTLSISGTVNLSSTGLQGVTMTLASGVTITVISVATTTTDASGNYSFTGLANGDYTIIPSKTGYTFYPPNSAQSLNGANISGINFAATNFLDISHEFSSSDLPSSVTWDGQNFWVSNYAQGSGNDIIYKYDKNTGQTTGHIPSPSQWTDNLCFDGTNLWLTDYLNGDKIFKISRVDGSIISSFVAPATEGQARGIASDGQYLYYARTTYPSPSTSTIYKIDPNTGTSLGTVYATTIYAISGITYKDNSLFFLSRSTSNNVPSQIVNITMGGVVLSAVNLPAAELTVANQITSLTNSDGDLWYLRAIGGYGVQEGIVKFNP